MAVKNFRVVILGGGSGGISLAARLRTSVGQGEIAIVEPSKVHYYQPAWTLVGGGAYKLEDTAKPEGDYIPDDCIWIESAVARVEPKSNQVVLKNGDSLGYEILVVATGLQLDWQKLEGFPEALQDANVGTIYHYETAADVYKKLESFKGGRAIFVMPPVPIKCAGAPQKIMYLADDIFIRNGVREKSEVVFATAGKAMFGIPVFAEGLLKVVQKRKIKPMFQHRLLGVNAATKTAKFEKTTETPGADPKAPPTVTKETVELSYDFIHVVPPMSAHAYVAESGLAFSEGDQKGWLKVDKFSLQHLDYPNVFGIGDVTGVPNSKTGAAIRMQAPVVAENIKAFMTKQKPTGSYNGYSSCPLITGFGEVMLAEFGYDAKLMPTFPLDPATPHKVYWYLKKYLLPILYWKGMLKGRA